jgi:signal recognition particle receptor subunit beta
MTKEFIRLLDSTSLPGANDFPMVIQYNKRDLHNALPTQVIKTNLGYSGILEIEAVALQGIGVLDTLKAILNRVIIQVQATV